jgi:hypothetical protein
MNRSRLTSFFIFVLSMALVCAMNFARPAMAQAPAPTATPEAPPQLITINTPARGAQVTSPFTVSGVVALTPASRQVIYALHDAAGNLITQGLLNVSGEWNQAGVFTGTISFSEQALSGPAKLEVRAPDGSATIDVNIAPIYTQPLQGLSLSMSGVAGSAIAQRMDGYINQKSWVDLDALPAHIRVTFDGITATQVFDPKQKQIVIVPLEDYRAIFRNVQASIFNSATLALQNTLATQPPALSEPLLLLPTSDQTQAFHTAPHYVSFNGGKGVRYLTQLTQEITAATSSNLTYVFQGLTDDGRHLISAHIPISTTALPASAADVTKAERDAMKKDYKGYVAGVVSALDNAPQSFTPALAAVDAMLGSIIIGDALFPRAEPTPTPEPQAAPASLTGRANELLNVRAGPSTRNRILDQIRAGASIALTGRTANGQWLRVALADGRAGWVSARYVDIAGDVNTLPVAK